MSDNLKGKLIQFRRDLHRIPELGFELPKTRKYLMDYMEKLPCEIIPIGKTSFCAFFDGGKDEAFAYRTDMDALPIDEKNDVDYCSTHEGKMHACGHDGHMSVMLGFAGEVAEMLDDLPVNVLLIFQAAEETTGGAHEITKTGIFDKYNVQKVYGLHIWPEFPKGSIVCRPVEFMAGTIHIHIDIKGKSSHVANPEKGVDALAIGCEFVEKVYKMEKNEIPADVFRLLKFGMFHSGTGINIISNKTSISGTCRFYDQSILDLMMNRINEISNDLMFKYKCEIEMSRSEGYPPVINPKPMVKTLENAIRRLNRDGEAADELSLFEPEKPFLVSEDFSYYQHERPGLFFFLGTGMDTPLHNERYQLDEDVLINGVSIFKELLNEK